MPLLRCRKSQLLFKGISDYGERVPNSRQVLHATRSSSIGPGMHFISILTRCSSIRRSGGIVVDQPSLNSTPSAILEMLPQ